MLTNQFVNFKRFCVKTFSAFEWLLIDIGTQWGLDKEVFEVRLAWAKENFNELETLGDNKEWKEKPLYIKAISIAYRKEEDARYNR